jgi:hypothetical protein
MHRKPYLRTAVFKKKVALEALKKSAVRKVLPIFSPYFTVFEV